MSAHLYAIDTVPEDALDEWLEAQEDRLAEKRMKKNDLSRRHATGCREWSGSSPTLPDSREVVKESGNDTGVGAVFHRTENVRRDDEVCRTDRQEQSRAARLPGQARRHSDCDSNGARSRHIGRA